jgi:hypothetical protein
VQIVASGSTFELPQDLGVAPQRLNDLHRPASPFGWAVVIGQRWRTSPEESLLEDLRPGDPASHDRPPATVGEDADLGEDRRGVAGHERTHGTPGEDRYGDDARGGETHHA